MRVERFPPEVIGQFYPQRIDAPVMVYGGVEDGVLLGAGGLMWSEGRCWLWFDLLTGKHRHAVSLVRWAQRMLRTAAQLGETAVYVLRDETLPQSKRLVEMLGFELVEVREETGKEVYRCLV